jgi:hypothetical protein
MDYEKEIDKLGSAYGEQVALLAGKFLSDVITPFCEKYNLEFTAGMGGYCLRRKDGRPYSTSEISFFSTECLDNIPLLDELEEMPEEDLFPQEKLIMDNPGLREGMRYIFETLESDTLGGNFAHYF